MSVKQVVIISDAITLTLEHSACMLLIDKALSFTISLPPPPCCAGTTYELMQNVDSTEHIVRIYAGSENGINGIWQSPTEGGSATSQAGNTYIDFLSGSVRGDCAIFRSDGVKWNVSALTGGLDALQFANV